MPTILTFHLNTPAVQLIESTTQPGATIKISGVDTGTAYTKTDYFASQSNSGPYFADSSTSVSFIINYLVEYASGKGNGIGKITGTIDVDAGGSLTINATDVGGNIVAYTVTQSGIQQTINLSNPLTAGKIEVTTGITRYKITTIPTTATVTLIDSRDGTILPIAALFANGAQYALPILNASGASNDILYSVSENSYETATGKFTVTRTGTGMTNTVTFATDGNEKTYTWNGTSNPRVANIELEKLNLEYDITFAVSSADSESEVTVVVDGIVITPEAGGHYIIPFVTTDTPLNYTIKAEKFRTLSGELLLKPDGTIEDITSSEEKDSTISYNFSVPESKLFVQLMPSFNLIPTGATTAIIPLGELLPYCFSDHLNLYGSRITGGKLELVNNTGNDYEIVGVEVIGHAELNHNVFRTFNDALDNLGINGFDGKFSDLKEVTETANAKYPGENFNDYYDYLLFYYKNIYVSSFGKDYSNITSLDELEPLDMGTIWTGNVLMDSARFDGTQADKDAGLVYEFMGPNYAYIENDTRLVQLAEKLISEFAFYFTFDNTKAGPIPIASSEINEQNEGLRFFDYVNHTPKNDLQVKKMFDYIITANSIHRLTNIAMSIVGSYAHNGFINNGLSFSFEVNLITEIPVIDVPYVVEYYQGKIGAETIIGKANGASFPVGHQLTNSDIEGDIGINWLNAQKPEGYKNGVVIGSLPIISMTFDDNVIRVLYEETPAPTFSYAVKYYKNTISEDNLLETILGASMFPEGHQLTSSDIANDIGMNWLNAQKPEGCKDGIIVGVLPIISMTFNDNTVTVLYEEIPTPITSYTVKYYKEAIAEENFLGATEGSSQFPLDYQLTFADIEIDIGANWINARKPEGYKNGIVVGSLPIISLIIDNNVVNVVYYKKNSHKCCHNFCCDCNCCCCGCYKHCCCNNCNYYCC